MWDLSSVGPSVHEHPLWYPQLMSADGLGRSAGITDFRGALRVLEDVLC